MLQDIYPFRICEISLPQYNTGSVYFLFQFHKKLLFTWEKQIVFGIDFDNIKKWLWFI